MILRAPAKLNLCLYLGGDARRRPARAALALLPARARRPDRGRRAAGEADEVVCAGVDGPNLAAVALEALRARGWERPPLRVEIEKRIPVAAGLGGGSADAAGDAAAGRRTRSTACAELAAGLGADVPSQLDPRFALVSGAGEVVEPLPAPGEFGVVLIPDERGARRPPTVYAEADRLGLGRDRRRARAARGAAARGGGRRAPRRSTTRTCSSTTSSRRRSRCARRSREALAALEEVGARRALVTGSGPTAFGLFEDIVAADAAAAALPPRYADAIVTAPQAFR